MFNLAQEERCQLALEMIQSRYWTFVMEDHLADDVQGDQFPYIPPEDEIPF